MSVMNSRRFTAQYLPCSRMKGIGGLLRCGISILPMSASGQDPKLPQRKSGRRSSLDSRHNSDPPSGMQDHSTRWWGCTRGSDWARDILMAEARALASLVLFMLIAPVSAFDLWISHQAPSCIS